MTVEPYIYSVPSQRVLYKPVEGVQGGGCHLEVFLPPNTDPAARPADGWPVAILIHGGAFIVGGPKETPPDQLEYLLAAGYACVDIEYRLAPHVHILEQNADCSDAYHFVRKQLNSALEPAKDGRPLLDVNRIALVGYSAGAYLAAQLACTASPPPKALVGAYGLYDLVICGTSPKEAAWLGLKPQEKAFVEQVFAGPCLASADHERERPGPRRMWMTATLISDSLLSNLLPDDMPNTVENRRALSPTHLAASAYPATFLIVPQLDTLVAPSQSFLFAENLRSLGVDVATGRADMAPHAYDRKGGPENAPTGQWWETTKAGLDFLIART